MATVKLHIGPADQGRKLTIDEFSDAEERPGHRYELAREVLEVVEIPADDHAQIVNNLHEGLSAYRRGHPEAILRIGHGSEIPLIVPDVESDRHPDLAIVFRDAGCDAHGRRLAGLVVEVVSPGREAHKRDCEDKCEDYLVLGIPEYWVVDPWLRQVTVLTRRTVQGTAVWVERFFRNEEFIVSESLPGFSTTVSELWVDTDTGHDGNGPS
jgi:Uma2 family endonuclease